MKFQAPTTVNNLKPETAHVWFADLMASRGDYHVCFSLLSKDERNKAAKFKFQKDRNQYVLSRGFLRRLSGSYLGIVPKDIVFEYGEFGKPKFAFSTKLQFNISHSANMAVFAFTMGYNIGADIELIESELDVMDLAQNFFSLREFEDLKGLHPNKQKIAFYRCWTRKEAFIKAKGTGLSFPLKSFSVSLDNDLDAELLLTEWNPAERLKWKLFSYKPSDDYIAAIAVPSEVSSVTYRDWNKVVDKSFVIDASDNNGSKK